MMERFKAYFEKLEALSIDELDRSAEKLVRLEKRNVALLIAHIAEISRRKAELERGYRSIFDYCVTRLNLSEGSVALRLQVANVSRTFPQLLVALAENRLSLTVAGLLAAHLDEENVETLLSDCAGMTKRAAEEYLVRLRPKPVFTPSIRRQPCSAAPCSSAKVESSRPEYEPAAQLSGEPVPPAAEPEEPRPVPQRLTAPLLTPASPDSFNFRFAADRRFKEKLERLAEVLGVENPLTHMAEVLEHAVDVALDQKDPKRKRERRLEKERRKTAREGKSRPDEILKEEPEASRYVSSAAQERVHERAGYQCQFVASDGRRCTSRTGLEIEHERPFAVFRSHDERFLRVLANATIVFERRSSTERSSFKPGLKKPNEREVSGRRRTLTCRPNGLSRVRHRRESGQRDMRTPLTEIPITICRRRKPSKAKRVGQAPANSGRLHHAITPRFRFTQPPVGAPRAGFRTLASPVFRPHESPKSPFCLMRLPPEICGRLVTEGESCASSHRTARRSSWPRSLRSCWITWSPRRCDSSSADRKTVPSSSRRRRRAPKSGAGPTRCIKSLWAACGCPETSAVFPGVHERSPRRSLRGGFKQYGRECERRNAQELASGLRISR